MSHKQLIAYIGSVTLDKQSCQDKQILLRCAERLRMAFCQDLTQKVSLLLFNDGILMPL